MDTSSSQDFVSSNETPDVAYQLNLNTGALTWDDALYSAYGYDHTEPTSSIEWWSDHIHPDDAMLLNQTLDKLTDPKIMDWLVSYRFRLADNTYITVADSAKIQRDTSGQATLLTGVLSVGGKTRTPAQVLNK